MTALPGGFPGDFPQMPVRAIIHLEIFNKPRAAAARARRACLKPCQNANLKNITKISRHTIYYMYLHIKIVTHEHALKTIYYIELPIVKCS